jgi:site-specific DNA-methyltransferase (adenine-specific)
VRELRLPPGRVTVTTFNGAALDVLRTLPAGSVDACVTSPPYYQLRAYPGEQQTRWADGMCALGREKHPDLYIEHIREVFHEVALALKPTGSLWLNIGDTYSKKKSWGRPPKSMLQIPHRVSEALQDDGWLLRNAVVWEKPNAMPSSAKDRFTSSYEYVFVFFRQEGYYFDDYAGREPSTGRSSGNKQREHRNLSGLGANVPTEACDTRHPRDVWSMATASYKEAHYAVFPEDLPERCIKIGCPESVCGQCGAPYKRVVERKSLNRYELPRDHPEYRPRRYDEGKAGDGVFAGQGQRFSVVESKGFDKTCNHTAWARPGVVLDPFLGSGTTAAVADRLGRDCIGIELNPDYLKHTFERLSKAA